MAALNWEDNIQPIPVSQLQPFVKNDTTPKMKATTTAQEGQSCIVMDYHSGPPEKSYIQYLHRVFGFPHTSPDTMTERDFTQAYSMAIWSRCHHCHICYKTEKSFDGHMRFFDIQKEKCVVREKRCPKDPAVTEAQANKVLYNCTLCNKSFGHNKRPKNNLGNHLRRKGHMEKVNSEEEHKEHERLCHLAGITVE